jgi:hypothetical protein
VITLFVLVVRMPEIGPFSKFSICNTALLTVVTMLYISARKIDLFGIIIE